MRAVLLVLLVLFRVAVAAPGDVHDPWAETPSEPEAAWALVSREWVPAWEGRQRAADARAEAAAAYFSGGQPLVTAFPALSQLRLDDPVVLTARLLVLDDRAVDRAAARIAPVPDFGSVERAAATSSLEATLAAEERADDLARRFLLAVRAHLRAHPGLTASSLAPLRQPVEAELATAIAAAASQPDDADAARRVAELDAELQRLDAMVASARRAATLAGAPPVDVAADLARLDGATPSAVRADARLAVFGPLSGDPAAVDAARAAWRQTHLFPSLLTAATDAAAAPSPTGPPDALAARAADLDARIATLASRVPDPLPTGDGLRAAMAREAALRLAVLTEQRRRLAETIAVVTTEQDARSASQLARESERTSLADADRAGSEALSAVLKASAAASGRAAARFDRNENVTRWFSGASDANDTAIAELKSQMTDVRSSRPVLIGVAEVDPDLAYQSARRQVSEFRRQAAQLLILHKAVTAELDATKLAVSADQAALADLPPPRAAVEDREARDTAVERWRAALVEETRAARQAITQVRVAESEILSDLRTVKRDKRSIRKFVSPDQRRIDWESLPVEAKWEVVLIGPNALSLAKEQLASILSLPFDLLNPVYLTALLSGSFWVFVLSVAWFLARRRARALVDTAMNSFATARRRRASLERVQGPAVQFLRALLDLGFGYLLRDPISAIQPLLGFAVWVYLQVALYRFFVAIFDLVVAPYGDARPSLLTLGVRAHALARRSLRWVAVWAIGRAFVHQVLLDALGAEAIDTLARAAIDVAAFAGLVILSFRWAPLLRSRIRSFHQESRWVRFLSADPPGRVLDPLYAVLTLLYLTAAFGWDRLQTLARERQGVGRMFATVARMTIQADDPTETMTSALPAELLTVLSESNEPVGAIVAREAEAGLQKAFSIWDDQHNAGLVVLSGDVGDGKRAFLDRLVARLDEARPTLRLNIKERLRTEVDAFSWVANSFDLTETPSDLDEAVAAVEALESSIVVVEGMERSFLRTVGGFEALQTLLYVLNASSRRHFVLLSFHRNAWNYLNRLGSLINRETVRQVVEISPLGEKALRTFVMGRLTSAGWNANFAGLVRANPFGVDPAVEIERATGAFFQLLADAADGNPQAALRLFARCLVVAGDHQVNVRTHECLARQTLDDLTEDEMFSLVALRTQGTLTESELVRVTNMGMSTIRNVIRNLSNRGLVVRVGNVFGVNIEHIPVVNRTLRRRHFLHFTA